MFTADPADERHRPDRHRGGLRPGRSRGVAGWSSWTPTRWPRRGCACCSVRIGHQSFKIIRGPDGGDLEVPTLGRGGRAAACSPIAEVLELARLGLAVERALRLPAGHRVGHGRRRHLPRPVAPHHHAPGRPAPARPWRLRDRRRCWSRASPPPRAWPRDGSGCCSRPTRRSRLLDGEVLVAPMTSPDWVPAIRRAAALVTDGGGMTCHAAIVSRELGVPCVVGTRTATTVLRDGELVTVDGASGRGTRRARRCRAGAGWRTAATAAAPGVAGPAATRAGHPALREPGRRRARRGGRRPGRRRRRPAAGRVHGGRRPRRRPPAAAHAAGRAADLRRRHVRLAAADHPGLRRPARSSTGASTSAATSSAAWRGATSSSRTRTTR